MGCPAKTTTLLVMLLLLLSLLLLLVFGLVVVMALSMSGWLAEASHHEQHAIRMRSRNPIYVVNLLKRPGGKCCDLWLPKRKLQLFALCM